jgi:hypothetical protein
MRFAVAFARFWWDFVVGDEWRFAVIVCAAAALGALAAAGEWAGGSVIALAVAVGLMLAVSVVIVATGLRSRAAKPRQAPE